VKLVYILFFKSFFRYKKKINILKYSDVKEVKEFYSMLLRIEKRRTNFSAKRVVKKVYPNLCLNEFNNNFK
jgi:hypothetical protein